MTGAPLTIRPYLEFLTEAELHAVMVTGLSTMSGGSMLSFEEIFKVSW